MATTVAFPALDMITAVSFLMVSGKAIEASALLFEFEENGIWGGI